MTLWYSRARVIVMLLVEQHSNSAMREGATFIFTRQQIATSLLLMRQSFLRRLVKLS